MNTYEKHSPLPWEADLPNLMVVDPYGNVVAACDTETFGSERMPNAELIAIACNNHYKLLGALKRLANASTILSNLNEGKAIPNPSIWVELYAASKEAWKVIGEMEKRPQQLSN